MQSLQTLCFIYFKRVPKRAFFPIVALMAGCGFLPLAQALSPQPKEDLAAKTDENPLPSSQEATEESVLPEEPLLSTPTPPPLSAKERSAVQALPSGGILQPSGPTVDEQRKTAEAFRSAKTMAEEQFAIADLHLRAFSASTDREKRALLREYYQEIGNTIARNSPALANRAQIWAFQQQNRLSRTRTEPDYQPPTRPAGAAAARTPPADNRLDSTSEQKVEFRPSIDN